MLISAERPNLTGYSFDYTHSMSKGRLVEMGEDIGPTNGIDREFGLQDQSCENS